jgi:hypothetical protein
MNRMSLNKHVKHISSVVHKCHINAAILLYLAAKQTFKAPNIFYILKNDFFFPLHSGSERLGLKFPPDS